MMRVAVVGSGGREHALAWKIAQSPRVREVYCIPGNGGTATEFENLPSPGDDFTAWADFAVKQEIGLTVVGPEAPLTQGIVDCFERRGLRIIGPTAAAARLEGSKIFAKEFMGRHGIPTSPFLKAESPEEALQAVRHGGLGFPLVIKADGLAAGKGVVITDTRQEAERVIRLMMEQRSLGQSGDRVILEQFLRGEELSFLVFSDGLHILPMSPSQDHKTIYEGDTGPNTGGMGAYSADWLLSQEDRQRILDSIVLPTIEGMAAEGTPYRGVLYFGLMMTEGGPQLLEFNARMGDPETQPILFRLQTDLLEVFEAILDQRLDRFTLSWDEGCSVCVVLASGGYPGSYETGKQISGIREAEQLPSVKVFHAGTALQDGRVVSAGGRVLGVTAKGPNLKSAINTAYRAVDSIHFHNMHFRRDIGHKGLLREP
ncbi:MAG: phosphoribosylamine--glycine ligase [Acidobacteriota bacterium]